MADASHFHQADDNTFSAAFADIYLQDSSNLEQVDPSTLQDHDLSNINEEYPTIHGESFMELLGPAPAQDAPIETNENEEHKVELSSDKIDEIESNQFAPKTKKQTNWGVRKFKGT